MSEMMDAAAELMPRITNNGHRMQLTMAMNKAKDGDESLLKSKLADYLAIYLADGTSATSAPTPPVKTPEASPVLPVLPDTYTPPDQGAMLSVETLPGYHASLWRDNDMGLQKMKAKQVAPAEANCPFIPEHERKRLRTGHQHGFLCLGDLVIGIETDNHYAQRMKADVSDPADAQRKRLPDVGQGQTKGELRFGQTEVIKIVSPSADV